ncbi:MAG TPA: HAD-IA family hydrolase [Gaiellaceae bacterium]
MKRADIDAVTLDAHGTLVKLVDPVPALVDVLAERGVERSREIVLAGFRTEAAHYAPRASEGYDEDNLERLRRDCASVFLDAVGADLDAGEFAPAYVGALRFEALPGVVGSLERLRSLGLELAVVANWDVSLQERLEEVGLARYFRVIVHAAGKPSPAGLLRALARLGIDSARALHIGDDAVDERAALAAGMHFAAAPVQAAVAALA